MIGEAWPVLRDLPELPVQSRDNIRRVYDFPNLRWVFKESAQNFPVFLPALDTGRILLPPGISKLAQILLRLVQGNGGIDFLQVCDHFLDVLISDIFGRAADLMDNAALQTTLGIHSLYPSQMTLAPWQSFCFALLNLAKRKGWKV